MSEHCVALLGRPDQPTDAVEEYCRYLSEALRPHNFVLEVARVNWAERGWPTALSELRQSPRGWRGHWVLLQYTALAWSRRGFPLGFLRVVHALRHAGARIGVVYHDARPHIGTRLIDLMRRTVQRNTMRRAFLASELIVLTVPLENLAWLPADKHRAVFIPVGANLPSDNDSTKPHESGTAPTIAVFGITGGEAGRQETEAIIEAVRLASKTTAKLRLQAFGRGADLRENRLREGLQDLPIQLEVSGIISPVEITGKLSSSDVLLFVRGAISTRRGSAIAGIACGLPVVAYAGSETAAPITEAGVVLVSEGRTGELGEALTRVLSDQPYRKALAEKSRAAYESYFSWPTIAARYAEALRAMPRS